MTESATRIVEIQNLLATANLSQGRREALVEEQRDIWDRDYPGFSFDRILWDAWLPKVPA